MRVLFISDVYFPRVNGVSTSIRTFRQDLANYGVETVLVAPRYASSGPDDEYGLLRVASGGVPRDPEDRRMRWGALRRTLDTLPRDEFDVVHIHTPFIAHYAGARFARRAGIPCVATYHTFFEEYVHHYVPAMPRSIGGFLARAFTRSQCDDVQALIAPSDPMRDILLKYGVSTPIHVLPTGLPADRFAAGDGNRFRTEAGLPLDRPLMTYVGRVAHEKNIEFLVQVFTKVRQSIPNAMLVIAGEGPARESLRQLVTSLKLDADVYFAGYLDRNRGLLDCYAAANVFAFASRTETQGLVLLEAMAQGAPVVSTAELGTRSILKPGCGAVVVEERQDEFAAAVVRVLQSPELQKELGDRGRVYAKTWSSAFMARRLADLYDTIRLAKGLARRRLRGCLSPCSEGDSSPPGDIAGRGRVLRYTSSKLELLGCWMGAAMGAKRALIVDDSKSARLFLARILEKYELDVDNAENAESAIEYLATHRPDVIFMDHMMPGMDGFQAVQAIKNNPRTATIPIMMYTSQEGELYLGQARALGAIGVLPKQIKQADVSKVLYQLHLVTDRRRSEQTTFTAVNAPGAVSVSSSTESPDLAAIAAAADPNLPVALTTTSLREQFAELRRALVAGVDTQTDRITAEVRALLLESLPPPPPGTLPPAPPVPWGWVVASVALAIALVSTMLWWRNVNQLNGVSAELAQLQAAVAEQQSTTAALLHSPGRPGAQGGPGVLAEGVPGVGAAGAGRSAQAEAAKPTVMTVPYGADALGGTRLEAVRQLVYRLVKDNASGVVDVKTYAGRFCLVGNSVDGFSLAPDETLFAKCDLVGNPSDDALSPAQHTPLALANLAGDVRHSTHGALQVQSMVGDPAVLAAQYPPQSGELTAGEWNRAASANNRVEIRVR